MRLLRFHTAQIEPCELCGDDLLLRTPQMEDYVQWLALRQQSREFLRQWEAVWDPGEFKRAAYRQRIKRYQADMRSGKSLSLFLFTNEGTNLVGGLSLSNIKRGVSQSCTLGYWMGKPYAGKGLMKQAVKLVIPFVFDELKLHRLEAAAIAGNTPSIALLENCGFVFEGKGRKYLKINGKWQDHQLYALLADDPRL